jgi:hypothetical protein
MSQWSIKSIFDDAPTGDWNSVDEDTEYGRLMSWRRKHGLDVLDEMKLGGALHNRESPVDWDTKRLAEDNIGADPGED